MVSYASLLSWANLFGAHFGGLVDFNFAMNFSCRFDFAFEMLNVIWSLDDGINIDNFLEDFEAEIARKLSRSNFGCFLGNFCWVLRWCFFSHWYIEVMGLGNGLGVCRFTRRSILGSYFGLVVNRLSSPGIIWIAANDWTPTYIAFSYYRIPVCDNFNHCMLNDYRIHSLCIS